MVNIFYHLYFQIIGALLRQSVVEHLGKWWVKIWIAIWWISSLILSTAYSGSLIAFLTVPAYPHKIQTIEELAESNLQ